MAAYQGNTSGQQQISSSPWKKSNTSRSIAQYGDVTMSMHASAPILSVKDRMRSWTKTPATKLSSKKGGAIPRSSTRRPSLPTIDQTIEDESISDGHEGSSDSNTPSKARTWAMPSPVPAYATLRSSLNMVAPPPVVGIQKQQHCASLGGSMTSLPSLARTDNSSSIYSPRNLRKVDTHNLRRGFGVGDTINNSAHSISSIKFPTTSLAVDNADTPNNDNQEVKSNCYDESDDSMMESSSSLYLPKTQLRKVEPPVTNKWKTSRDDEHNGSGNESFASSIYTTAQLKKVEPPKEDKWKDHIIDDNNSAVLYSAQELRPVTHPIDEKRKEKEVIVSKSCDHGEMPAGETTGEIKMYESKPVERPRDEDESELELDVTDLRESSKSSGNKRLLMLVSSTSGRQEQKTAQDRALTILKGMRIDSQHLEQLDGADPKQIERRNELFAISGIRAHYPQFFLVDADDKVKFLCTWDSFELMHDMDSLSESMNLDTYPITSSSIQKQDDVDEEMVDDMEPSLSSPGEAEEEASSSLIDETQDVIIKENDVVDEAGSQDGAPAPPPASEEVTEDEVLNKNAQEEESTPSIDVVKDDESPSSTGEDEAKVVVDEENAQEEEAEVKDDEPPSISEKAEAKDVVDEENMEPDDGVINDADVRNEALALSPSNGEEVINVKNIEETSELVPSLTDEDKVEDITIPSSSPNGNEVNEEQTAASNRNEKLQSDTIADESDAAVEVEEKEDDGDGIDNDDHNAEEGVTQTREESHGIVVEVDAAVDEADLDTDVDAAHASDNTQLINEEKEDAIEDGSEQVASENIIGFSSSPTVIDDEEDGNEVKLDDTVLEDNEEQSNVVSGDGDGDAGSLAENNKTSPINQVSENDDALNENTEVVEEALGNLNQIILEKMASSEGAKKTVNESDDKESTMPDAQPKDPSANDDVAPGLLDSFLEGKNDE